MFYFSQGFIGKNTNEVHSKTTNNAGNVINKCCKIKALYFPDLKLYHSNRQRFD